MLSNELEACLNDAFQMAREGRHEFLTVEHLLYSILETAKLQKIDPAAYVAAAIDAAERGETLMPWDFASSSK